MHVEMQITALVLAGVLLLVTLELVRRNRLLEDYSILGFVLGLAVIGLASWESSLTWLARITGVVYAPSAVFICALVLCFALLMHFSVIISRLTAQVNALMQQVALLKMGQHAASDAHDQRPLGPRPREGVPPPSRTVKRT